MPCLLCFFEIDVSNRRGQLKTSHIKKFKLFMDASYEKEIPLEIYAYSEPQIVLHFLQLVVMQLTISLTFQIKFSLAYFNSMSESGTFHS